MIPTSRNNSCKILSCLGEKAFFYSEFFPTGNHYRNVKTNFFKKKLCSQQELFFRLVKNSSFHLTDIPGCENSFSVKWKRFFNEFFIPGSRNGKSIFLFRDLLKFLKIGSCNFFFWELLLWPAELIFHFSDFLSSENCFLFFIPWLFPVNENRY